MCQSLLPKWETAFVVKEKRWVRPLPRSSLLGRLLGRLVLARRHLLHLLRMTKAVLESYPRTRQGRRGRRLSKIGLRAHAGESARVTAHGRPKCQLQRRRLHSCILPNSSSGWHRAQRARLARFGYLIARQSQGSIALLVLHV